MTAQTAVPEKTLFDASIMLVQYLQGNPDNCSTWLNVDEHHKMRVDVFNKKANATLFGVDDFGVVQIGNPYTIVATLDDEDQNPGEFDVNTAAERYRHLMGFGDVGLRAEAKRFMRSGDTILGWTNEQVAEYILGKEIEGHPDWFTSEGRRKWNY